LIKKGGNTDQIVPWVQQAQAGDRQAFHRLADLFQAEIFRMIYYRTRSKMDAEDLTQDVFLRAFKHVGRLSDPALFRGWLYSIAVNRVRDHHRRQRIKAMFGMVSMDEEGFQESEEMAAPPEAAQQLARGKFWDRVRAIMAGLPRMEREVFYLRFFDQLSIKEITEAMHKNESTVKTHLYRALSKVKAAAEAAGLTEELP
jgi:RNA polymerase sigma-70 factor (ECF subfamily)